MIVHKKIDIILCVISIILYSSNESIYSIIQRGSQEGC
jgi:hypothetical protein